MRHFFSTKVRIVLVVALLLTAGLAVLTSLTGTTVGDLFVKGVLTPLRSGAQSLTAQAEKIYNYIFEYESLSVENEALKQELAQLQDSVLDNAATQRGFTCLWRLEYRRRTARDIWLTNAGH